MFSELTVCLSLGSDRPTNRPTLSYLANFCATRANDVQQYTPDVKRAREREILKRNAPPLLATALQRWLCVWKPTELIEILSQRDARNGGHQNKEFRCPWAQTTRKNFLVSGLVQVGTRYVTMSTATSLLYVHSHYCHRCLTSQGENLCFQCSFVLQDSVIDHMTAVVNCLFADQK